MKSYQGICLFNRNSPARTVWKYVQQSWDASYEAVWWTRKGQKNVCLLSTRHYALWPLGCFGIREAPRTRRWAHGRLWTEKKVGRHQGPVLRQGAVLYLITLGFDISRLLHSFLVLMCNFLGQTFFQIYYKKGPYIEPIAIPGCKCFCKLSDANTLLTHLQITPKQWRAECEECSNDPACIQLKTDRQ